MHTVDAPEGSDGIQGISKSPQASAVGRLSASLKTRLGGSFSVLGADSPVSFEEHETGRQLIEAAKVCAGLDLAAVMSGGTVCGARWPV